MNFFSEVVMCVFFFPFSFHTVGKHYNAVIPSEAESERKEEAESKRKEEAESQRKEETESERKEDGRKSRETCSAGC